MGRVFFLKKILGEIGMLIVKFREPLLQYSFFFAFLIILQSPKIVSRCSQNLEIYLKRAAMDFFGGKSLKKTRDVFLDIC